MPEDTIHQQEFTVRDLPTKSVTLYPARAQVTRDVEGITLKPGTNEVIIHGITPTANESSIKVDGKGAATIIDMTVTLVDNKDRYEDLYPSDSEESESEEEEESDAEIETERSKKINADIEEIKSKVKDTLEDQNSAIETLDILREFGHRVGQEGTAPVSDHIHWYATERKKAYELHKSSITQLDELRKGLEKKKKELQKELKPVLKEKDKLSKAKYKQQVERHRIKAEIAAAKAELKKERTQFWPKQVYKVTLTLDASPDMTPLSSRRGSRDTLVNLATKPEQVTHKGEDPAESAPGPGEVSLSISYITQSASWTPRYDLNLDTIKCNGSIAYRAEFVNETSETWKDASLILSTSQTMFQGLDEAIPELLPWPIRLNRSSAGTVESSILFSKNESDFKRLQTARNFSRGKTQQKSLFGMSSRAAQPMPYWQPPSIKTKERIASSVAAAAPPPPTASGGLFGSSAAFGASLGRGGGPLFGHAIAGDQMGKSIAVEAEVDESDEEMGSGLFDANTYDPTIQDSSDLYQPRQMAYQESNWEEAGLTATYDVPGKRTISPSTTPRRHKIATITLKDIQLSYFLVPKLRTAAFLEARLRNNSNITLLKGLAGLTLDGSFLGTTELKRCSAGESFPLNLGVDPAVNVSYSKPTVRRSQTGVFSKEGSCVFTRVCTLTNTKSKTAIEGVVMDQVPVSEDERLRVEVLQPKGLKVEGDRVKTGIAAEPVNGSARGRVESIGGVQGVMGKDEKWGKAVATFKKSGEVAWDVKVNPSQSVRLVLEYETRFPGNEGVVGV